MRRYLNAVLRFRWPLVFVYLAAPSRLVCVLVAAHREPRFFPMSDAPLCRIRLRAPAGTRIEETERIVLRALDVIRQRRRARTTSRSPAISWAWCRPAIQSI